MTLQGINRQGRDEIISAIDGRLAVSTENRVVQLVPDFQTPADMLGFYGNFEGISSGDFVTRTSTSNGQVVTVLSGSPLTPGESVITLGISRTAPCALEIEASMIRARQQFATISLFQDDVKGADPVPSPINIVTIYQSTADNGAAYNATAGTICTVVLESALPAGDSGGVFLSDWINIDGLVDTRLNYKNACIKYISPDRKTITFGFSDEAALPSIAVTVSPSLGTAKVYFYNNMAGAHNGMGMRFTGTTATSAALISIFGGGDVQVSGTLLGDHRVTISSSAPIYTAGGVDGNYEIRASSRYRLEVNPKDCAWYNKTSDTSNGLTIIDKPRTSVKPALQAMLAARFRLYKPVGMTRPVAKIISIAKSGSTTWTVTHDGSFTFTTGQYVTIKGNRDQTNFASFTTPVAITVVNPTKFTLIGTTGTATGYGGSVILCQGSVDQPNIIGQAISSATIDALGWLTVVSTASWSGLNVGDYIDIHGARVDLTGANLGIDGAWEVANISTTTMKLKPIYNIFGQLVSPNKGAFASTNCGGSVILRTTLRSHDFVFEAWEENKTQIEGQGTNRQDKSLPVRMVASDVTMNTQAVIAVDAVMGNPQAIGGRASNANISAMSATGDLVGWLMTMIGVGIIKPYSIPEADWSANITITTNTASPIKAAAGVGIKNYCTAIQLQNTNATATTFTLQDGSTNKWTISLPASMTIPILVEFPTPIQTSANAILNGLCGTNGANVLVNAQGYFAP